MSKKSTQNFLDVVPDFDGKSSLPMLDVSSNVLSLAKTITSSAVDLRRLNAGIEETRLKTQFLADCNEKNFALHNKIIDDHFRQSGEAISYSGRIIDLGIKNSNDLLILQGLNAMVTVVTHEPLPKIPDFSKQLDSGATLQLGYDKEENTND